MEKSAQWILNEIPSPLGKKRKRERLLSLRHFQFCFYKHKFDESVRLTSIYKRIAVSIVYLNIVRSMFETFIHAYREIDNFPLISDKNYFFVCTIFFSSFHNRTNRRVSLLISDKCVRVFWGTFNDSVLIFPQQFTILLLFSFFYLNSIFFRCYFSFSFDFISLFYSILFLFL